MPNFGTTKIVCVIRAGLQWLAELKEQQQRQPDPPEK